MSPLRPIPPLGDGAVSAANLTHAVALLDQQHVLIEELRRELVVIRVERDQALEIRVLLEQVKALLGRLVGTTV